MSATPMLSLAPCSNLIIVPTVLERGSNKNEPNRFLLFNQEWIAIQSAIATMTKLPADEATWNRKYGAFANKNNMLDISKALSELHALAVDFGDPTAMKGMIIKNSGLLAADTPPADIYTHIVWLAAKIADTAETFTHTFDSLEKILNPIYVPDPETRAKNLREVFVGPIGLRSRAEMIGTANAELVAKLEAFKAKIIAIADKVNGYTSVHNSILKEANAKIAELDTQIAALKKSADEAYDKYRYLTMAAALAGVLCFFLSALSFATIIFTPLAGGIIAVGGIAAVTGMSIAAAKANKLYHELTAKMGDKRKEKAKKTLLVTDLTDFKPKMESLSTDVNSFSTSLGKVNGVWTDIGSKLTHICDNYSDEKLADLSWVMAYAEIDAAKDQWKTIAETAHDFITKSLISASTELDFGDAVPEEMP